MAKLKVLNLYAGIGGNRKLWSDEHEITAVENNPAIAAIYQDLFPNDTVIVGDAHQYLMDIAVNEGSAALREAKRAFADHFKAELRKLGE